MANTEQLALLRQGLGVWNEWRQQNKDMKPDLHEARLNEANLREANLQGTDLREAHLIETNLREANLREANLSDAKLINADVTGANLTGANLTGADLRKARLSGALLNMADFFQADLRDVVLDETVFGDTNLRDVQGLDTCDHWGPSTIDHRTLTKSAPLPLAFLRGCGLPDQFIDYLPSLLQQPIQFYSCFISYSTHDQDFAERLHADLQNKGVRCWFAPHKMKAGEKVHEQIDEAIRVYDRLLLILSEESMNSRWVKTEIAQARQRELTEKRHILFPIGLATFDKIQRWKLFDADIGDDSARDIREYFIPDFSGWKDHNNYQRAFERLLGDLKAEENGQP